MPALLATAAVFIPARSAKGVACKSVTIGLLISLIFLGEGVMCVLMTAPLFYLVALFVGGLIDMSRRPSKGHNILSCLAMLSLVPMSLEGVVPITTIARSTVVSETRIVQRARGGRRGGAASSGPGSIGRCRRSSPRASPVPSPPRSTATSFGCACVAAR